MKTVYPAIFTQEEAGYSVRFPDVPNCFTSGESLNEALEMAADVLNLMLLELEDQGAALPTASELRSLPCGEKEFASLIAADTLAYRKQYGNQAVKKTLSIPAWLNTLAERAGVNFSAVLQKALRAELHLP